MERAGRPPDVQPPQLQQNITGQGHKVMGGNIIHGPVVYNIHPDPQGVPQNLEKAMSYKGKTKWNGIQSIQPYHLFSDHTEFEAMYIKGVHLGQGSYGAAYKVTSKRNKKLFVLKEIIKVATSRKERERDRTEIEILKKCSHENIGKGSFHFVDNHL